MKNYLKIGMLAASLAGASACGPDRSEGAEVSVRKEDPLKEFRNREFKVEYVGHQKYKISRHGDFVKLKYEEKDGRFFFTSPGLFENVENRDLADINLPLFLEKYFECMKDLDNRDVSEAREFYKMEAGQLFWNVAPIELDVIYIRLMPTEILDAFVLKLNKTAQRKVDTEKYLKAERMKTAADLKTGCEKFRKLPKCKPSKKPVEFTLGAPGEAPAKLDLCIGNGDDFAELHVNVTRDTGGAIELMSKVPFKMGTLEVKNVFEMPGLGEMRIGTLPLDDLYFHKAQQFALPVGSLCPDAGQRRLEVLASSYYM